MWLEQRSKDVPVFVLYECIIHGCGSPQVQHVLKIGRLGLKLYYKEHISESLYSSYNVFS